MNCLKLLLCTVFIMLFGILSPARAAYTDEDIDALLGLDIQELVEITVASKKEETLREAPSVVSVVTADDIKKYGYVNLMDIFSRTPSLQAFGNNAIPYTGFSVRGQANTAVLTRTLILLNGRPHRESQAGGSARPLLQTFPVSAIERLEFIRGPGSVLYGSNAFSSVVNIVTKKAKTEGVSAGISQTYGSFSRRDTEGHLAYMDSNKGLNIIATARSPNAQGWKFEATDLSNTHGSYHMREDGYGVMLDATYKGLSLSVESAYYKENHWGAFGVFPNEIGATRHNFIDLGYRHDLNANWHINTNITRNNDEGTFKTAAAFIKENRSGDTLFETNIQGNFNDKASMILGGSLEVKDGKTASTDYHTLFTQLYTQFDYWMRPWLKLVGGLQMNQPEGLDRDYSPRAAAIALLDDHWTGKLMYGEAFRAATAVESFIVVPGVLLGNPNLQPERIKTLEAQLTYENEKQRAAVTLYNSRMLDIIAQELVGGTFNYVTQEAKERYKGIEFEFERQFGYNWTVEGSLLYHRMINSLGQKNRHHTPNIMAKAGVHYDSHKGWGVGVFDAYYGAPEDMHNFKSGVLKVNPAPDAYHMLTANLNIDIPQLINKKGQMPDMSFALFGENLLDQDIDYPETALATINSLPLEGGRAIYGRLTIKF